MAINRFALLNVLRQVYADYEESDHLKAAAMILGEQQQQHTTETKKKFNCDCSKHPYYNISGVLYCQNCEQKVKY